MAVTQDVIELILQTKGAETIENLEKSTANYKALLGQLIADHAKGEIATDEFLKAQAQLSGELSKEANLLTQLKAALQAQQAVADSTEAAIYDLADAYDMVGDEMSEIIAVAPKAQRAFDQTAIAAAGQATAVTKAGEAVKKSGMNIGQAALDGSRALEDLQYGIGGVINNIPSLVMSLGGSAGLTAVISVLAVTVAQAVKNWDKIKAAFQETTTIPKVAGDVSGLQNELSKARDRMKELGDRTSVTLAELAEFNGLRTRTVEIEKQITAEQERQKRAKQFDELKDPTAAAQDKARADALQAQLGGSQGALQAAFVRAAPRGTKGPLQDALDKAIKASSENLTNDKNDLAGVQGLLDKRAEDLRKQLDAEEERIVREARQTVIDAVTAGNKDAFKKIQDAMAASPDAFTAAQKSAFSSVNPETAKEKADREQRAKEKEQENAKKLKEIEDRNAANVANVARDTKQTLGDADSLLGQLGGIGKGLNKEARQADKATIVKGAADASKATDAREKALRAGTLDEEAAAMTARLRASRLSPERQEDTLNRFVGQRVQAAHPDLNPVARSALTNRFTQGAGQQVDDQMAGLVSQGMNQQQAALQVVGQTQAIVAQLLAKQRGVEAAIGQLRNQNQDLRRQVRQPGAWNGNPMGGD